MSKKTYFKKYKAEILNKYDNNKDDLISINEYLDIEKSLGPKETEGKIEYHYQDEDNVYNFFSILQLKKIKDFKILCIPKFEIKLAEDVIIRSTAVLNINSKKYYFPEKIKNQIKKCDKKKNTRLIYFSLKLLLDDNSCFFGHANVVIIDLFKKTIERFEPHGCCPLYGKKQTKFIDTFFNNKVKKMLGIEKYKYISPINLSKEVGIQIKADAYNGMCITISMMYLHMRVLNVDKKPNDIIKHFTKKTKKELRETILRYAKFIEKTLKKETKFVKMLKNSFEKLLY